MAAGGIPHNPGNGYKLKVKVGSGAWKTAYRGSSPSHLLDVALLCYHESDPDNIAKDAVTLIRLTGEHPYARHVAQFINIFKGADRRVWIVEELLQYSLLEMAPLRDIGHYCSIARDLCRGLSFIHSRNLVHRDLKLDNCGVDRYGVAKIFDIGSVTTEPGRSICTILTCPPEAIEASTASDAESWQLRFDKRGDVWALGATLFGLRVGHYPFVTADEMQERMKIGHLLAQNKIERDEYKKLKAPLDARVRELAGRPGAEALLKTEISRYFDGWALRLLSEMLSFEPGLRPSAEQLQGEWGELAANFSRPSDRPSVRSGGRSAQAAWQATVEFLEAVLRGKISATPTQVQNCIAEWEKMHSGPDLVERDNAVDDFLAHVKSVVEDRWEKRSRNVVLGPGAQLQLGS